jgi:sarcosine oxidase delta subunit
LKGWLAFVVARTDTRGDIYEEWVDIQGEAWYLSVGERVEAGRLESGFGDK